MWINQLEKHSLLIILCPLEKLNVSKLKVKAKLRHENNLVDQKKSGEILFLHKIW